MGRNINNIGILYILVLKYDDFTSKSIYLEHIYVLCPTFYICFRNLKQGIHINIVDMVKIYNLR